MSHDFGMNDQDWARLLRRIKKGEVTPFLGAGACIPAIPKASDMAQQLTDKYPLHDKENLMRVAQYLRVFGDKTEPKEILLEKCFSNIKYPDFTELNEPHGVLADLPLPVYITTNYDDFMTRALLTRNRLAKREFSRWNQELSRENPLPPIDEPTDKKPLVFHLHGSNEHPESMVLTEDDYIDFLVHLGKDETAGQILPPIIRSALVGNSLLFMGYSLNDLDFRVLFQGFKSAVGGGLSKSSFTLQLNGLQPEQKTYVEKYFGIMDIKVAWGDARSFALELRQRWEAYKNATSTTA